MHCSWLIAPTSLSARRAWIEIGIVQLVALAFEVALRKESVDRNVNVVSFWMSWLVALRKESVDRNQKRTSRLLNSWSRSPQGERG